VINPVSTCTNALRPAGANRDCCETPSALSTLSGNFEKVLDSGTHSRVDTQLTMANTRVRAELTTGQLGAATGVSADTIRHYEKLGLLKKAVRSDGGYRLYGSNAIPRVQTIRSAVKAGFSLAELSGIFQERDAGGVPCQRVAGMAAEKVDSLEKQIRELIELKDWLVSTVNAWHKRLEHMPPGKLAGLLESLRQEPIADPNQPRKGTSNENARPHLRPVLSSRSKSSNNHGMPHARSTSKV
jgi:DNA-binding transcriptional MerR regulator